MVDKMTQNTSLRENLILFEYILSYLGLKNINRIRQQLKREKIGYDVDGRSFFLNLLKRYHLRIEDYKLEEYDENIKSYLDHINIQRSEKINLKYFQYLAILFTEIFLDNLYNNKSFIDEINSFSQENFGITLKEDQLSKLAYWMATGSGKTLLMHINYLQFHKYNKTVLDNIILLTSGEGMSKQHLEELRKSNIPARIFDGTGHLNEIIEIIEIHKLEEQKTGEGVSVGVDSFEGNNLVFVDEGHKGFSGEKWKKLRDMISVIGFTFEYSATFEEAIGSRQELFEEYSKSIIFDYSYRFFYHDGFGKEFTVMNLKDTEYEEHKELILLCNLLSYYQQVKYFRNNEEVIKSFFLEKPLWIFVGNNINKGTSNEDKNTLSDLEFVLNFLNKFLINKDKFIEKISDLLSNKTFLYGTDGILYSENLFRYIISDNIDTKSIYIDIIKLVFNAEINQHLELRSLDTSKNEIALKVSGANNNFGLINIGDKRPFIKRIEEKETFHLIEDKFSNPFFEDIDNKTSPINILLGARRFIEGWNSYRVSNMGLLNKGAKEGSQIIQLFGRGVRLKGYKKLLKRSEYLIMEQEIEESDVPPFIDVLETLNIFGIKADYVDTFRKELDKNGLFEETLKLKIKKEKEIIDRNLITLGLKEDSIFKNTIHLKIDDKIPQVKINLNPRVKFFGSTPNTSLVPEQNEIKFNLKNFLKFINWDRIYFEIYDFKQQKEYYNLYFTKKNLKSILEGNNYEILVDESFKIDKFSQIKIIESVCIRILKIYIKNFYNLNKRKWVTQNVEYSILTEKDSNFKDYILKIDKRNIPLIKTIKNLINEGNKIYENDRLELNSIYFDKHLYQPLIGANSNITTIPTGLNEGEVKFIRDLKDFFRENKDKYNEYEFFIFRNLSKRGIGFFTETYNFFPDFIMWVIKNDVQKIIFLDPKGLVHSITEKLSKIELNNILKDIESKLGVDNVKLASFIISVTPFEDIKELYDIDSREEFENLNVLFQEQEDYISKLISKSIY